MDLCVLPTTWRGFGPVLSELLKVFNGSGRRLILKGRCTTLKLTHRAYKEQEAARISLKKRRCLWYYFCLLIRMVMRMKMSMFGKVCCFGFPLLLKPNGRRTCNLLKKKCHRVYISCTFCLIFTCVLYATNTLCKKNDSTMFCIIVLWVTSRIYFKETQELKRASTASTTQYPGSHITFSVLCLF